MVALKNKLSGKKFEITTRTIIGGNVYNFDGHTYMTLSSLGKAISEKANRMKGSCAVIFNCPEDESLAEKVNQYFRPNID